MKKKQILVICLVIVIILLAIIIGLRMSHSNQHEFLNEINTQNINVSNTDNIVANESKNSENIGENNVENSIANSEEILEEGSENVDNQSEEVNINLIVNDKTFTATLNHNETVNELISMLPMTLHMSDLHANEKYNYLDSSLTTNSNTPGRINAVKGNIKEGLVFCGSNVEKVKEIVSVKTLMNELVCDL